MDVPIRCWPCWLWPPFCLAHKPMAKHESSFFCAVPCVGMPLPLIASMAWCSHIVKFAHLEYAIQWVFIYSELGNYHRGLLLGHFHHPKGNAVPSVPVGSQFPSPYPCSFCSKQPQTYTLFLGVVHSRQPDEPEVVPAFWRLWIMPPCANFCVKLGFHTSWPTNVFSNSSPLCLFGPRVWGSILRGIHGHSQALRTGWKRPKLGFPRGNTRIRKTTDFTPSPQQMIPLHICRGSQECSLRQSVITSIWCKDRL